MRAYWPWMASMPPCSTAKRRGTPEKRGSVQSTVESVTRVWLLRHGASTFNVEGRYQGCCDAPELTREGRIAARLSGERLRPARITTVISSPLRRAFETAQAVRGIFHEQTPRVPFETDVRLREVELPTWEGLPYDEVKQEFPAQFSAWRLRPYDLRMPSPSGEDEFPVRSLYERVRLFWKDVLANYAGESVLLVTHGGTARALITTALGLGVDYFQRLQQSNCGISRLSVSMATGRAKLELLNDTAHLGDALLKLKEGRTGVRLLLIPAGGNSAEDDLHLSGIFERVTVARVLIVDSARPAAALSIFRGRSAAQSVSEESLERSLKEIRQTATGETLCQVALVAPADFLRRFLERYLGLPGSEAGSLELSRCGITSIHCPGNGAPPVLQGMNLFESELNLAGVCV